MTDSAASVELQDGRLVFDGALLRPALAALWPRLAKAGAISTIDLTRVPRIDSAGIALIGWLADNHPQAALTGTPAGYEELRIAYRLDDHLRFER
ncbi:STAS domain-containing protein [Solilutibacter silvestris]|uniref:STAS domain-containing protein n=1 Tax=Solilutibacter silvestris TaxID=1645665 RepID=UPI003D33C5DC